MHDEDFPRKTEGFMQHYHRETEGFVFWCSTSPKMNITSETHGFVRLTYVERMGVCTAIIVFMMANMKYFSSEIQWFERLFCLKLMVFVGRARRCGISNVKHTVSVQVRHF